MRRGVWRHVFFELDFSSPRRVVINEVNFCAKMQTDGVVLIIGRRSVENRLKQTQRWDVPLKFRYAIQQQSAGTKKKNSVSKHLAPRRALS